MKASLMVRLHDAVREEEIHRLELEVAELAQGLNVEARLDESSRETLPKIEVKGEDCEVLVKILDKKWGVAPARLSEVKVNRKLKGLVTGQWISGEGLLIDVGIRDPKRVDAVYSSPLIEAQLGDGQGLPVGKILEHFCLFEDVPVETTVIQVRGEEVKVSLSGRQVDLLWSLDSTPNHKLIVTQCLENRLRKVLCDRWMERNVLKMFPLSLNVHLVHCAFGVDGDQVKARMEKALGCPVYSFRPSMRRRLGVRYLLTDCLND
jgi:hypothetical protein